MDNGSTASYVYNALGERVEKSTGGAYTEYVFGQTRQPMGEYNRSAWTDSWVTFEGRHFAHFSNGDTYFVHSDRIGTTNIVTDWNTGTVIQDELHYPWGQVWTSAGSMVEERFAGLQHRDAESNLDPTEYRMFSSDDGRWTTPDPADQYSATPTDPQTFNRYAYALNNSTNLSDPFGLKCIYNDGDVLDDGTYPPCNDPSVWTSQTVTVYGYPRIPWESQQILSQVGANNSFMENGWFYAGWFGFGVAAGLVASGSAVEIGQAIGATIETYAPGAIQATTDFISGLGSAGSGGSTSLWGVAGAVASSAGDIVREGEDEFDNLRNDLLC